ncbi:NAD(P)H-binding protein, partial [uncultured Bifidobacterium sp.]|uniref:NAD(P)H-binding protein n=1 Tax=uncultured Bifidobacterium sp. TaxID=165187 RepID=UPI00258427AE
MKIAVVAANGKEGQLVVKEAVKRGHDVTAVVRGENKSEAQHAIIKDLFDLTAADLAGFDVVVDAFGVWAPEDQPQHSTSLKTLCDALSGTDTRLIVCVLSSAGVPFYRGWLSGLPVNCLPGYRRLVSSG